MDLAHPGSARGQSNASSGAANIYFASATQWSACGEPNAEPAKAALGLVCLRERLRAEDITLRNVIVIGFVGGFVSHDDPRHPEVLLAALLRERYPSVVHAEVFSNHDGKHALRRVLQLLDTDQDRVPTSSEKEQASIIIYGHSWGASQAVNLARGLGRLGIPVSVTILVDSVHKPGHKDAVISSNVQTAGNFYQSKGLIHGRSNIRAADPERTNIIGNFEMKYQERRIKCDNYPWIARHLNTPHHEIENDPLVWGTDCLNDRLRTVAAHGGRGSVLHFQDSGCEIGPHINTASATRGSMTDEEVKTNLSIGSSKIGRNDDVLCDDVPCDADSPGSAD